MEGEQGKWQQLTRTWRRLQVQPRRKPIGPRNQPSWQHAGLLRWDRAIQKPPEAQGIWAKRVLPVALYCVIAPAITWPLPTRLSSHLPLGSEPAPTVPYFNLWTLGWNADRLSHSLKNYWDAPIFHPVRGSFAFSDPQPLTGLLAAPVWQLNPALAYNLVLLLFLALNGLAVYHLLRNRGTGQWPALLSGMMAQALPFLTCERGVLQLQPFFGAIWALDNLWNLAEKARWRNGVGFGLAVAATFLTSQYYGLFLGFLLVPALLLLLGKLKESGSWLPLLFGTGLSAALVLPIALAQRRTLEEMGFQRGSETIRRHSATASDYGHYPDEVLADRLFPRVAHEGQRLFPGYGLLLLGLAGALVGLYLPSSRRWTLYLVAAGGVAFLGSFGLNFSILEWQPYNVLRTIVPGFENLRSPYRLAVFVQLSLTLLGSRVLGVLWQKGYGAVGFSLGAVALLEIAPVPGRLAAVPPTLPRSALQSPVVLLPFPSGRAAADYSDTALLMYASLPTGARLLNGYSGYFPQLNAQLKTLLADFPTPKGLTALRSLGVRTILIVKGSLDSAQWQRLQAAVANGDLAFLGGRGTVEAYLLRNARFQQVGEFKGSWKVRARVDGRMIELAAYAAVPDGEMYFMGPGIAPLHWLVQISAPDGGKTKHWVSPTGCLMLFDGSDRWPRVHVPSPTAPGEYHIELCDAITGRILGESTLQISGVRPSRGS